MLIRRPERRSEQGSVMIAMTVIFVVTLLMMTTLGTLYSGLTAARNDQNRTNAFQSANAGMDEAVHRLDRKLVSSVAGAGYQPILSGGTLVGFRQTVATGSGASGAEFVVEALQDPPGQDTVWRVTSTGTDASGRARRAIATVTAKPVFENGFLTLQNFYLTGTQVSPVAYDSKTCPEAGAGCEINPVPARLATNATFDGANETINSFVLRWQGFEMYGRPTQSTADFACAQYRCGTSPKVTAQTNQYVVELPNPSNFTDACPSGGNIGTSSTSITPVEPGNYRCDTLNLQGTINVGSAGNGTGKVRFFVIRDFSAASGSVVNRRKPTANFQVFQCESLPRSTTPQQPEPPEPCRIELNPGGGSICGAEIWGLLYAPGLPVECGGSAQPKIYGAVVAKLHGGTGSHFDFHWDVQSRYALHNGKYVIKNWRECPASATDC